MTNITIVVTHRNTSRNAVSYEFTGVVLVNGIKIGEIAGRGYQDQDVNRQALELLASNGYNFACKPYYFGRFCRENGFEYHLFNTEVCRKKDML